MSAFLHAMGEFELIASFFADAGIARQDVVVGVGDDGAVLQIRDGYDLVVTTDTMVSGTHFFPSTPEAAVPSWMALRQSEAGESNQQHQHHHVHHIEMPPHF